MLPEGSLCLCCSICPSVCTAVCLSVRTMAKLKTTFFVNFSKREAKIWPYKDGTFLPQLSQSFYIYQSCTRDSKPLCQLVGRSVRLSVGPSVSPSVRLLRTCDCRSVRPSVPLLKFFPESYLNRINAPAHPYATDAVVYMAQL